MGTTPHDSGLPAVGLPIGNPPFRVGPRTRSDELLASPAGQGATEHLAAGRTCVRLKPIDVAGRRCHVDIDYVGNAIERVRVVAALPGDGATWADWTLANELKRKAVHESLAQELFGQPLTIKPVILEENSEPVFPMFPKEEDPRHAVFSWGEVISAYDSKAGEAFLSITYRRGAG